jgi:hypothetical protein
MFWSLLILLFIFAEARHRNKASRVNESYRNMFLVMDFVDGEDEGL